MDNKPCNCSECEYWLVDTKNKAKDNRKRGECRKSEPSLGPNGYGYWPMTLHNEFCFAGKAKQRELLNESLAG
jgi:hypothetical protein